MAPLRTMVSTIVAFSSMGACHGDFVMQGDSWALAARSSLNRYCKGSESEPVAKHGIGGTQAWQWNDRVNCDSGPSQCCHDYFAAQGLTCDGERLQLLHGDGRATKMWLSVGGNDIKQAMGHAGCPAEGTQKYNAVITHVLANIVGAIQRVKEDAPGMPIIMTGYGHPASTETAEGKTGCEGEEFGSNFDLINNIVKEAAAQAGGVQFVDGVETLFGASRSPYTPSDQQYFQDGVHLNQKGYCKLWTMPEMQDFFGCESESYDCDALFPSTTDQLTSLSHPISGKANAWAGSSSIDLRSIRAGGSSSMSTPPTPKNAAASEWSQGLFFP